MTIASSAEPSVLIVGAGPTGLALACWLQALGVRFRIVDAESGPGTTSRALGVQARTLELYRQLGLADRLVGEGMEVSGANLWSRGRKVMRLPLGRIGEGLSPYPYLLVIPQDVHERILIDWLAERGVAVSWNTRLAGLETHPAGVRARLVRSDGAEDVCEAAYLAGCDGASSTVRSEIGAGFPGGTYEGLFYVADVAAGGPTLDDEIHIDLDEGDFVAVFPYRGRGRARLVGAVRKAGDGGALTFEDVRGSAIERMRLEVEEVRWFSTYRVHHRVADRFADPGCRVFLLGDAAHIHSPAGGQGMNTGIGDAVNLAWKLAAVVAGEAPERILGTYESERIGFARRLVRTTDRVFAAVTRRGAFAELVRLRLVPLVVPWIASSAAFRRFAFRTVSQIAIEYRDSDLSEGFAGGVHGGDRLPWIPLGKSDSFEPLRSLAWQAHVHGTPAPALRSTCEALDVPLHAFAWSDAAAAAGLAEDALYLVRPDGYVGLAAAGGDEAALRSYLARHELAPADGR